MLVPPESSLAVLVMIRSKSASICNRSLARLDDSSRNRAFRRGYPNLMHSYGGLLEPRGSSLTPLKFTFNAEYSCLIVFIDKQSRTGCKFVTGQGVQEGAAPLCRKDFFLSLL